MFPTTCQLQVPWGFGQPGHTDWRLIPTLQQLRAPRRGRQGWGPAVLWSSPAQGSHIISTNSTAVRHLSSSVYSVHKPSFGSIRFNKHLLNICAVSDHIQGTRAIRMKNTWTGLAVMLFYSFIVPQTLFTWLISINLVRSNRAHTGTAFPLHNGESWASERPSPSPKITRLINVSSGPRIRDSIFHSMFNTQFFHIAFFFFSFFYTSPWHTTWGCFRPFAMGQARDAPFPCS